MNYPAQSLKGLILLFLLTGFTMCSTGTKRKVQWISSTEKIQWLSNENLVVSTASENTDAVILTDKPLQIMEGFGACFNELGWTSLNSLNEKDRESVMEEMFGPGVGGNFNICRMPVGANDFSHDWYSYNETEGDFKMKNFSIENDLQTLVPFIQNARKYNPELKIWASPWSPPSWMKWNSHYACSSSQPGNDPEFRNSLDTLKQGKEGSDLFIQKDEYFAAYALYFSKFIKAYHELGINIFAVMPQNEFNSCQIFPSCTWTAGGLSKFIGSYLGPAMNKENVEIMFGTMERPNISLIDTIMNNPVSGQYIKGFGFQWAGKGSIADAHKKYPDLKLYQSEQECGDGKNDWTYCCYAWTLMKHYISNGASAYMYWNISLDKDGFSRWGWRQNSLVSVDLQNKTYKYNFEYYLIKHASHFVLPGARRLETAGAYTDLLAFENPDKSIVIILHNDSKIERSLKIRVGTSEINPLLKADSFNTFVID